MTREILGQIYESNSMFINDLQEKARQLNATLVITVSDNYKQLEYKDYSDKRIANIMSITITDTSNSFEDRSYKRD